MRKIFAAVFASLMASQAHAAVDMDGALAALRLSGNSKATVGTCRISLYNGSFWVIDSQKTPKEGTVMLNLGQIPPITHFKGYAGTLGAFDHENVAETAADGSAVRISVLEAHTNSVPPMYKLVEVIVEIRADGTPFAVRAVEKHSFGGLTGAVYFSKFSEESSAECRAN